MLTFLKRIIKLVKNGYYTRGRDDIQRKLWTSLRLDKTLSIKVACIFLLVAYVIESHYSSLFEKTYQMAKLLRMLSFILWLIRSFMSIWIRLGFHLIYGNQKFRLPAITNHLLLQPATVIAKRIRQRQVN